MVTTGARTRALRVRAAKTGFSALVKAAALREPVVITRHGRPSAVMVPVDMARRFYPEDRPSFADFLLSSPGAPEDFERDRTSTRSVDL